MLKKQIIFILLCTTASITYIADAPPKTLDEIDIEQTKRDINEMLKTHEFYKLYGFANNYPNICEGVMKHDNFGAYTLQEFFKNCRTPEHRDRYLPAKHKINLIRFLISQIPNAELEKMQPNGQALIHSLSTFHWNPELIKYLHERKVDLTIPTQAPDKYPGSTIAAIVICFVFHSKRRTKPEHTANAHKFLCNYFNYYPEMLTQVSLNRDGQPNYCWNLLNKNDKRSIYPYLNQEAQSKIKNIS